MSETDDLPEKQADKPGIKDGRQTPVYRALQRVVLGRQIEVEPGELVDLSHLPQESIRKMIQRGIYETADGVPVNEPLAEIPPCKNC